MPCSTRIRCAEWARRSASCAAASAGGTGSWFFRRAGRGVSTAAVVCALEALVAGVGEQGGARGEGQQLDQAGLADLGQVMNPARAGLSAEQQPPLGIGDHQRLDRVGAGLARGEPRPTRAAGRPVADPDLGGGPGPRWHPAGRAARWRPDGLPHRPGCAAGLRPRRCPLPSGGCSGVASRARR
jgi:hypothetical protein